MGTRALARSVNSNPGRGAPNTPIAVRPASRPGVRAVASACAIVRPARSSVTSISTSPASTGAAKTHDTERNGMCPGTASCIARAATASDIPPHGTFGAVHVFGRCARYRPGGRGVGA